MTVKLTSIAGIPEVNFSNWIIYVTVKQRHYYKIIKKDFSNWIIYVTVKHVRQKEESLANFSNWIIYLTVKRGRESCRWRVYFSNWIIYVTLYKTKTTNNIMSVFWFIKNQTRRFWFIKVIYKNDVKQLFTVFRLSTHCVDNLEAVYLFHWWILYEIAK